jgi:hypothetical protein
MTVSRSMSGLPFLDLFPLGSVSARVSPSERRRTYHCRRDLSDGAIKRTLTVAAAESSLLPSAEDLEVFLALVRVWSHSGMTRTFQSSLRGIGRPIGWSSGYRLKRLKQSIDRWLSTTFVFEEEIESGDGGTMSRRSPNIRLLVSALEDSFTWHELVHRALQSPPWTHLNFDILLGLRRATSRQLMLFLSSQWNSAHPCSVSLQDLSLEHLGLSRALPQFRRKKIVEDACAPLVKANFLEANPERFSVSDRGAWMVTFAPGAGSAISRA